MKRAVCLLLAALGTVFLPVPLANGGTPPVGSTDCRSIIANAGTDSEPMPCHGQPVRENPVCLPCCVPCGFAVLTTADSLHASLGLVARLDDLASKGPSRSDPPPLPPPRRPGC